MAGKISNCGPFFLLSIWSQHPIELFSFYFWVPFLNLSRHFLPHLFGIFFLLCSIFEKIFRLPTKTRAGFIVADIMVQDEITQMQEE